MTYFLLSMYLQKFFLGLDRWLSFSPWICCCFSERCWSGDRSSCPACFWHRCLSFMRYLVECFTSNLLLFSFLLMSSLLCWLDSGSKVSLSLHFLEAHADLSKGCCQRMILFSSWVAKEIKDLFHTFYGCIFCKFCCFPFSIKTLCCKFDRSRPKDLFVKLFRGAWICPLTDCFPAIEPP